MFLLDLSNEGVFLWQRTDDAGWSMMDSVGFDNQALKARLIKMRERVAKEQSGSASVQVRIPRTEVLITEIKPFVEGVALTEASIIAKVCEKTPYQKSDLEFDITEPDTYGVVFVAAVTKQTLVEAGNFVKKYAFVASGYTTTTDAADFPRAPRFSLIKAPVRAVAAAPIAPIPATVPSALAPTAAGAQLPKLAGIAAGVVLLFGLLGWYFWPVGNTDPSTDVAVVETPATVDTSVADTDLAEVAPVNVTPTVETSQNPWVFEDVPNRLVSHAELAAPVAVDELLIRFPTLTSVDPMALTVPQVPSLPASQNALSKDVFAALFPSVEAPVPDTQIAALTEPTEGLITTVTDPAENTDAAPSTEDAVVDPILSEEEELFANAGKLVATPDGTPGPQGILIYSGRPRLVPPARVVPPAAAALALADGFVQSPELDALASVKPRQKPSAAAEAYLAREAAQSQINTSFDIAALRGSQPRQRPQRIVRPAVEERIIEEQKIQVNPAAEEGPPEDAANAPATQFAVAISTRPARKPSDFSKRVTAALKAKPSVAAAASTAAATSRIPTTANVAKEATLRTRLNKKEMNLISVAGKVNNRRAIVRLPSGRYVTVKKGQRVSGWKVSAIGESSLRMRKGSRDTVLRMPN